MGPNCLQRLSADNTIGKELKAIRFLVLNIKVIWQYSVCAVSLF